ncbi:MAG: serine--tRNA ligase, partial [Kocuria sp.]|nr:serine--tRNA ligase [Kocuria sp.]
MIDINLLRENPDLFRASQRARQSDVGLVDQILEADAQRRQSINEFESLRAEQKSFGKKVSQAQGEEKETLLAEVKTLAQKVKAAENASNEAQATQDELLSRMENLVIDGVPTGGEEDYVTLKTVGEPRDFAS